MGSASSTITDTAVAVQAAAAESFQALADAATGKEILPRLVVEEQRKLLEAAAAGAKATAKVQADDRVKHLKRLRGIERTFGSGHPKAFAAANNLALALRVDPAQSTESEALLRKAVAGLEATLGRDHPETLSAVNNLAVFLDDAGKLEEAEAVYRQALQGCRTKLGPCHTHTLQTASSLAALLRVLGKSEEAAELYGQILQRQQESPEDEVRCLAGQALALEDCGQQSSAELLMRRALRSSEQKLGAWHPDALTAAQNLVELLLVQHVLSMSRVAPTAHLPREESVFLKEAEKLARRVTTGRRAQLGPKHPSYLRSTEAIGQVLLFRAQRGGCRSELRLRHAEEMLRRAVDCPSGEEGDNMDYLARNASLAFCLQLQGRLQEASYLYRCSVPRLCSWADKKLCSDRKPKTCVLGASVAGAASAAHNFASLLAFQGGADADQAECLYRWALKTLSQALGEDHASIRVVADNLELLRGNDLDHGAKEATEQSDSQEDVLLAAWPES